MSKACLSSYERHVATPRCPLCRTVSYSTRTVHFSARIHITRCVVLVQSAWRGFRARRAYLHYRSHIPPKQPVLLRKWREQQALKEARELRAKFELEQAGLQEFLSAVDNEVTKCRHEIAESVAALVDVLGANNESKLSRGQDSSTSTSCDLRHDDHAVPGAELGLVSTALQRSSTDECAICLQPLHLGIAAQNEPSSTKTRRRVKPLLLLDPCAHAYHRRCLTNLERFSGKRRCPICRGVYVNTLLIGAQSE
ncbi:hypothetical protein M427DRAFT_327996 [Gonapodya prolifera JEL478]|uniref:RING-type domain-containing protein n=1 Tax=Gonapodya prolifera (strain JEL478) TaxID=1344416 RepID=A0A139AE65_GONPJ|nr:hypothetical protein M427DRAFT_327996 [Gonapodya prolifera JEL478]|eukprot:KXS15050.1 hypothetical protein M427DRAFT_327996 [Gonapodya prolifera JEL478]